MFKIDRKLGVAVLMAVCVQTLGNAEAHAATWSCLNTYYETVYKGTSRVFSDRETYYPGQYTYYAGKVAFGPSRGLTSPRALGPFVTAAAFLSLFGITEVMDLAHTVAWPGLALRDYTYYRSYGSTLKLMTQLQLLMEVVSGRAKFSDKAGMKKYIQENNGRLYALLAKYEVDRFFADTETSKNSYMVQTILKSKGFKQMKAETQSSKGDLEFLKDLVDLYQNSEAFCNSKEPGKLYGLKEVAHSYQQIAH